MTNPFKNDKTPSLSFKDAPIGTVKGGTVTKLPELVQARNYETGDLEFWDDGNKKMTVVFGVRQDDGEERSVWAGKPSALFTAFSDATDKLGRGLELGDDVRIKFTGTKPNAKNARLADQKLYAVRIVAGKPADPFSEPTPAAQPAAQPAAPVEVAPSFDDEPPF